MNAPSSLQRPAWFFGPFALATLLLLPLWNNLADYYMAALVALVNNAGAWVGLPPQFQVEALSQEEAVNPGIVAGMGLFVVTPNRSVSWKMAWITGLVLFWWMLQSALLLQLHIACAHFLAQLPWPQRLQYDTPFFLLLLPTSFFAALSEWGRHWTSPLYNLLIWIVATRLH